MVKVLCIIQARLTSSRLPNKVMNKLAGSGKTVLEHVYNRLHKAKLIDKVIIAIPDTSLNDPLESFLKGLNIPYFRGSEDDVLARFFMAAEPYNPKIIVRATCDDPCVDWEMADEMIRNFEGYDYSYPENAPLGVGVEMMSFKALSIAYKEAELKSEREHVGPFIYNHPERFNIKRDKYIYETGDVVKARLTMDEESDYKLMNNIYQELYKGHEIHNKEIYDYLNSYPEVMDINIAVHQKGDTE